MHKYFASNVGHWFSTQFCTNTVRCFMLYLLDVGESHENNFQERILQLNKWDGSASTAQISLTRTPGRETVQT